MDEITSFNSVADEVRLWEQKEKIKGNEKGNEEVFLKNLLGFITWKNESFRDKDLGNRGGRKLTPGDIKKDIEDVITRCKPNFLKRMINSVRKNLGFENKEENEKLEKLKKLEEKINGALEVFNSQRKNQGKGFNFEKNTKEGAIRVGFPIKKLALDQSEKTDLAKDREGEVKSSALTADFKNELEISPEGNFSGKIAEKEVKTKQDNLEDPSKINFAKKLNMDLDKILASDKILNKEKIVVHSNPISWSKEPKMLNPIYLALEYNQPCLELLEKFLYSETTKEWEMKWEIEKDDIKIFGENRKGVTILMKACEKGALDIVNFLLELGANFNIGEPKPLELLMKFYNSEKCTQRADCKKTIQYLIENKAAGAELALIDMIENQNFDQEMVEMLFQLIDKYPTDREKLEKYCNENASKLPPQYKDFLKEKGLY
jgi:hypothetical protein